MKTTFRRCVVLAGAVLALGLAVLQPAEATGQNAAVSWVAPTAYTDGSVVHAGDIASYIVTWTGPTAALSGTVTVPSTQLSTLVTVPCNSTSFVVQAVASASATYPSTTSANSTPPVVYATGVTCTLNPPTGLAAH